VTESSIPAGLDLGQRIELAIQKSGKTKSDVHRALGVRWGTVHGWTRNKAAPSADNLRAIAEVTGVTLDELLGVASGQHPNYPAWKEFLACKDGAGMTSGEQRALASIVWQHGKAPTLAAYLVILHGIRAAEDVEDASPMHGDSSASGPAMD